MVLCAAVALAVVHPALAQPAPPVTAQARANTHLAAGDRLYTLGKFDEAIKEFEAGYEAQPHSLFLYNLGQCYRQLERYEKAIWYFERFLARGAVPPAIKPKVERIISDLKTALEKREKTRPPLGPLVATDGWPDAQQSAQPLPQPILKTAVIVDRGEAWYADPMGWGLSGVGGIGAGVTLGLVISAAGLDDRANSETSIEARSALHDRADKRRLVATVLGITSAGALATGIVKLAIYPKDRTRTVTALLNLGATTGLVLVGRF